MIGGEGVNLQLALDRLSWDECMDRMKETENDVDWIEIGTGVIKEYGMAIVREAKQRFPDHTVVADMKTCDAGQHEARQAFEAGADITTVMAFSEDRAIHDTLKVAGEYGKRVMVDLLSVQRRDRISELERMGVDLVNLHFGKDMQQEGSFRTDLFSLVADTKADVAVAGGIDVALLPEILQRNPETIIVGSAITRSENPRQTAAEMKGMMRDHANRH